MPGHDGFMGLLRVALSAQVWYSTRHALVAQLDRASDFDSEGREFESLRARQQNQRLNKRSRVQVLCWGNSWETFARSP